MQFIKFITLEGAQRAAQRIFDEAIKEGLFVSGTNSYAIPEKYEYWEIPVLPGFEKFFTNEELRISEIIENGYDRIKPSQGKIQLHRIGLLDMVEEMIQNSNDKELKLFWEYALVWEIENIYINQMANALQMTPEQIQNFFFEASKIQ